MNRIFYLSLCKCSPPPTAETLDDKNKSVVVSIDLVRACHRGFIDIHAKEPILGTNPFFDELRALLSEDEEFRLLPPGLGGDTESKKGMSWKYGRVMAMGLLDQHFGYRWFPRIEHLMKSPKKGWRAMKKKKGDTPDWLVSKNGDTAIAEAKGVSRAINSSSTVLNKWRTQAQNVRIYKGEDLRKVGGWIIATRWVETGQRVMPTMYVEDPDTDGEREILGEELGNVELYAGRIHTVQNLLRLGERLLAQKVVANPREVDEMPRIPVMRWRCEVPALRNYRFIGRLLFDHAACFPLPFPHLLGPMPLGEYTRLVERYLPLFLRDYHRRAIFDGLDLRIVKDLMHGNVPPLYEADKDSRIDELAQFEDLSLLSDGSLLAPAELMIPDGYAEL